MFCFCPFSFRSVTSSCLLPDSPPHPGGGPGWWPGAQHLPSPQVDGGPRTAAPCRCPSRPPHPHPGRPARTSSQRSLPGLGRGPAAQEQVCRSVGSIQGLGGSPPPPSSSLHSLRWCYNPEGLWPPDSLTPLPEHREGQTSLCSLDRWSARAATQPPWPSILYRYRRHRGAAILGRQ